jgi:hypothetical protein
MKLRFKLSEAPAGKVAQISNILRYDHRPEATVLIAAVV